MIVLCGNIWQNLKIFKSWIFYTVPVELIENTLEFRRRHFLWDSSFCLMLICQSLFMQSTLLELSYKYSLIFLKIFNIFETLIRLEKSIPMYRRSCLFPSLLIFLAAWMRNNDEHGDGCLCLWMVRTQNLLTCTYSKSCNSLLIITLFKVTEIRKRAIKEEKVSIEVPKREAPPVKGMLRFD